MHRILLIAVPLLTIASPALANPQDFLSKAMLGDNSETALGKLAEAKGVDIRRSAVRRNARHRPYQRPP